VRHSNLSGDTRSERGPTRRLRWESVDLSGPRSPRGGLEGLQEVSERQDLGPRGERRGILPRRVHVVHAFAEVVERLSVGDLESLDVETLLDHVVYLAVLAVYYAFVVFVLGISQLIDISGPGLVLYAQAVSFPLIVVPVLVELGVAHLAVHLVLPNRIARADPGLFFYDPRNLGGFEPIGQLLKRSYYIFTAVLLLGSCRPTRRSSSRRSTSRRTRRRVRSSRWRLPRSRSVVSSRSPTRCSGCTRS